MGKIRKELGLTAEEIMAELADLPSTKENRKVQFTPEQDLALWIARGPGSAHHVSWQEFKKWWARRWPVYAACTLRRRLVELEDQGGPSKQ
jgi:hypothetical protein